MPKEREKINAYRRRYQESFQRYKKRFDVLYPLVYQKYIGPEEFVVDLDDSEFDFLMLFIEASEGR